jgi:hypothetical protein
MEGHKGKTYAEECRGWRFAIYLRCHFGNSRIFRMGHRDVSAAVCVSCGLGIARCIRRGSGCVCALHEAS